MVDEILWLYWGKADPKEDGKFHFAILHFLDVAACAFALLSTDNVLRRKISTSLLINESAAPSTLAYFCALHDIGKLDFRFQMKAPEIACLLEANRQKLTKSSGYDHGAEGYRQITQDEENLPERLGEGGCSILAAVCGHHGEIPTNEEAEPRPRLSFAQNDKRARRALLDTFEPFFQELGASTRIDAAPRVAVQLCAGLCAIVDWIGSNTDWFPYERNRVDLSAYWSKGLERARLAIEAAGLTTISAADPTFESLFPTYLRRDIQLATEQVEMGVPSLVIVEAEMGQGKTEAAFELAARAISAEQASGIYVALPTMATSNAMLTRTEELVARLFPGEVQLALAHGRARRQPKFQRLIERGLRSCDADATEATAVCARWLLSKKRVLLAQVGVGTVDQAMQAVIRVRHQFVRVAALARSVVIIDEIHAYDSYMEVILEHLVRWLGSLSVPVLLLSATLPVERRIRFVAAWRGEDIESKKLPSPEEAVKSSYPQVTHVTANETKLFGLPSTVGSRARSVDLDVRRGVDKTAIARELVAAAQAGARVCWIRNTVGEAQQSFEDVESALRETSIGAMLFHSRFRGCDRGPIEARVLREFGKDREVSGSAGRVLIATQVVEQSLDLDFDWLVSDVAPIDLLLQRSGRLHRHQRRRPAGFERLRFTLLLPSQPEIDEGAFGNSAFVYDAPTLWLATRTLQGADRWILPRDIRGLVERTYHPELRSTQLADATRGIQDKEVHRAGDVITRQMRAAQLLIDHPDHHVLGGVVDDDDERVQALTRDGQNTTLLPVLWDGAAGANLEGAPYALDSAAPTAWAVVDQLTDHTLSLRYPPKIEPIPIKNIEAWQKWRTTFDHFLRECGLPRIVPLPLGSEIESGEEGWFGKWLRGNREQEIRYTKRHGLVIKKSTQAVRSRWPA